MPARSWAAGIAVIVTIAVILPLLYPSGTEVSAPATYRTLSAGDDQPVFPANSLRLVFTEATGEASRQDILRSVNAIAVTAPSPRGVLTVQVPEGELASALALLRERDEVYLAEPVFSTGAADGSD